MKTNYRNKMRERERERERKLLLLSMMMMKLDSLSPSLVSFIFFYTSYSFNHIISNHIQSSSLYYTKLYLQYIINFKKIKLNL